MSELQEIFEKSVNNPHDAAFKSAFKKLAVAQGFFESYLPERIRRHIDFDSLEITDGSYVDEKLRDKHSDIVYKTKIKGLDAFLYILFEHQSTPDPMMVFRLLCYMVNIWKEYLDQSPGAKCLPVIIPAVLYHGKAKWNAPRTMGGMIEGSDDFSEYLPDFTYELYDLGDYSDEMLMSAGNTPLTTVLYLFRHIYDGGDFGRVFGNAVELLKEIRMRDESVFLHFLEWVLRYTYHARNEDENTVRGYIDRGMDKINDENARSIAMTVAEQIRQRGIKEGKILGLGEGRTELIRKQLSRRFGSLSPLLEQRLRHSGLDMLDKFGESIFDFRDMKDAEKWWDDYGKEGNA